MKTVCAEYVNFPGEGNYDLGSIDNPSGMAVRVVDITDAETAQSWFHAHDANVCTFPLRALSPAAQAKARRAVARRREYAAAL